MSRVETMSFEEADERIRYEPETGRFFIRRHQRCPALNGRETRCLDCGGYVQINLKPYGPVKGHRLAWLLHFGEWPRGHIDHINGDRADNRIVNLRTVTNAINCQNKRLPFPGNTSGFLGVSLAYTTVAGEPRWAANVTLNRKQHHLGVYATREQAHQAYVEGKRRLHQGCTL